LLVISVTGTSVMYFSERNSVSYEDISIDVSTVNNRQLRGLVAVPSHTPTGDLVQTTTQLPAVIIIHGTSATKEMMRAFSQGYAELGFLTLSVDLHGHGASEGRLNEDDTSENEGQTDLNDGLAMYNYLLTRDDVDTQQLSILGHSRGGRAAVMTSLETGAFNATIVIGYPLTEVNHTRYQAELDTNLLMAVGKYDELFDPADARSSLSQIAGTSITEGETYGSFSDRTARKLVITNTDHLFEAFDTQIVEQTFDWISHSTGYHPQLIADSVNTLKLVMDQLYSVLLALLWLSTLVCGILVSLSSRFLSPVSHEPYAESKEFWWILRSILFHAGITLVSFAIGAVVSFTIGDFSSVFLVWFVVGSLLFYLYNRYRLHTTFFPDRSYLFSLGLGSLVILSYFGILQLFLIFLAFDFRYVLPIHSSVPLLRLPLFLLLWVVGIPYNIVEHQAIRHQFIQPGSDQPLKQLFIDTLKVFSARTLFFDIIIVLQFLPLLLGLSSLPPIFGFFTFFIIGIVIWRMILSFISTVLQTMGVDDVLISTVVSLLVAWTVASTIPLV